MTRDDGLPTGNPTFSDNAPCGLLSLAVDGRIRYANLTFCAWLQYTQEELQSMRFQALLAIGSRVFHQTHWMPLLQMQRSVAEVQLELVRRDGREIPMLVNAAVRSEAAGKLSEESVVDVAAFVATDRRKYERELLAARTRAEELLESERHAQQRTADLLKLQESEARHRATMAEQLIGIVSHDLRNPLNTIVLGAGLLRSTQLEDVQTMAVKRIETAAERATRLIVDLLDFTKARLGGGLSVTCRKIDLHQVIADCIEEIRFAWPGRLLEHQEVGEGEGEADPDRLAQLVGNLVNNAFVYGSASNPVVVTSGVEGAAMRLVVHNQGPPIPLDKQLDIFEPLSRGELQMEKGFRSVGLGLYIVREIAKAHGGDVALSSSEAAGTTFTIELPLMQSARGLTATQPSD